MNDQNSGVGGSYAIDELTGERRLLGRTEEPPAGAAPPARQPEPIEPAPAGFFTPVEPVAPADTPTTTTE